MVQPGLIVDMIPLLDGGLDMLGPCTGNPINATSSMGLNLSPMYGILTFLANQYAKLGINTKKIVGLVFTVHPGCINIYNGRHWIYGGMA